MLSNTIIIMKIRPDESNAITTESEHKEGQLFHIIIFKIEKKCTTSNRSLLFLVHIRQKHTA